LREEIEKGDKRMTQILQKLEAIEENGTGKDKGAAIPGKIKWIEKISSSIEELKKKLENPGEKKVINLNNGAWSWA
jgi:hypothetical protein